MSRTHKDRAKKGKRNSRCRDCGASLTEMRRGKMKKRAGCSWQYCAAHRPTGMAAA